MSEIQQSWNENAKEWINILDGEGIDSRKITNPAIIEAISILHPTSFLDVGCGEGWLARHFSLQGIKVFGVDATQDLISRAQELDHYGVYTCLTYESIIVNGLPFKDKVDVIALNFCLYEKEITSDLLNKLALSLSGHGQIVVQTLHPYFLIQSGFEYDSQWMSDSWKGLKGKFTRPHKWYCRTMEGWFDVFNRASLTVKNLVEPRANQNITPSSVIFTLEKIS